MKKISNILSKIWKNWWCLRSLPYTIFFNFYYLPLKQAVHLPIVFYKPKFVKCKGRVIIQSDKVKCGMICLGKRICSIYPDTGFSYENNGGTIIFRGGALIGNDSFISVNANGVLTFGHRFECNAALKCACHNKITFGADVSLGWDCFVIDTDFHRLIHLNSDSKKSIAYGEVSIGDGCWIATKVSVHKNTMLPNYCVVAAHSLLNKKYEVPSYTLLAGSPAVVKQTGVYRDRNGENDKIVYLEK